MKSRADGNYEIRDAHSSEFSLLPAIEASADHLFEDHGISPLPAPAPVETYQTSLLVLVAGDPPVAFARVTEVDGQAHLEQISVNRSHLRKGIGSRLVRAARSAAANLGYERLTTITFEHVPWNAPFYFQLGFQRISNLTPGLTQLREREIALGLDRLGNRVVLCLNIPPSR